MKIRRYLAELQSFYLRFLINRIDLGDYRFFIFQKIIVDCQKLYKEVNICKHQPIIYNFLF